MYRRKGISVVSDIIAQGFIVFPNPLKEKFNIYWTTSSASAQIKIINITGKI